MGSSRATAAALITALVCAPAAPVVAQPAPAPPPPAPNSAQMTQAKDLVNKAIAKSQAGDHNAAIELYMQAYNIAPLPILLSNLGSEYQQAQKPVEALKNFCKYLEAEPTGPNASYATSQAKVIQAQLHNTVDDNNVCKPLAPEPPVGLGSGSADAGAGSGSAAGQMRPPPPPPGDPGRTLRLAAYGTGAAGVVLAAVGLVYGAKAQSISNDITNHPMGTPWPDNIKDREAEGQSDENKQIGLLVVGGAAIVAGGVLYVLSRGKTAAATERMAIVPTAAPGYGGLALTGRW